VSFDIKIIRFLIISSPVRRSADLMGWRSVRRSSTCSCKRLL